MSAGDSEELTPLLSQKNANIFIFSLSLIPLYNKVQQVLSSYIKWTEELREILSEKGIQKLAEKGYEMLKNPVVILNMGFKMLAGCVPEDFDDVFLQELVKNGFLSYETVCSLVEEETRLTNPFAPQLEYVSSCTGNRTIIRRIYYNGNLVARVIVTLRGPDAEEYYSFLTFELAEYVQRYFLSSTTSHYAANTEIAAFIADLIERRLMDQEELEHRQKLIPAMTFKYYHTLVMSFEERKKAIPWNYAISQIEQIFPQSCITVYKNDIIILAKKTSHNARLEFDREKLMEILKFYDAYMAIGNYSKFLTSLHPIYVQTKATIRLCKVFRTNPEERIFYYEEASIYHAIDLCADNDYHNGNLIYLCHPALITIKRYDKKYSTDLTNTLYVYLTNNCNTVKAAKLMYVHRNTLYNKINKIEELIGQSLENSLLRERILFSFHVIEYQEKYMLEDPLVLKRFLDD
ncbi:MAG: hypothetical protein GXX97_07155 [Dehalococcoidales bacterium]|nr:hypothetical protein [Dehalococcoidales bacterium]